MHILLLLLAAQQCSRMQHKLLLKLHFVSIVLIVRMCSITNTRMQRALGKLKRKENCRRRAQYMRAGR